MQLRPYQERGVTATAQKLASGVRKLIVQLATGGGKCLAKDTPILMFDGTIKMSQNIRIGDVLMGPDSNPRNVLSVCTGREMMYDIIPTKGDKYTVNESHILSLKMTGNNNKKTSGYSPGDIVDISILDYIESTPTFKHCAKGFRVPINFESKENLKIDPYILGVWLGDGSSRGISFTCGDFEVADEIISFAADNNQMVRREYNSENSHNFFVVRANNGRGGNPMHKTFKDYNLIRNKHIPHHYKISSFNDRLNILAGIIDTDGYYTGKGFDICLKSEKLIDDIIFIARSLGFAAYKVKCSKKCHNNGVIGTYYRCNVHGDCDLIPCRIKRKKASPRKQKKNVLHTGISVVPVGIGEYFGFEIDGDRRFVLGDFTVTHNTIMFSAISHRYITKSKKSVLILVHRKELLTQTRRTLFNAFGINCQVIIAGMKHIPEADVYVGMVESVNKRVAQLRNIGLVIIDEAHLNIHYKMHEHFPTQFIIGFTATPLSANKRKPLRDYYEDIVCCVDIPELIKNGSLCQNITYAPKDVVDRSELAVKNGEFDDGMMSLSFSKPKYINNTVSAYERWAKGTKTIVFNVSIDHSLQVTQAFVAAGYNCRHVDGGTSSLERDRILNWFHTTPDAVLCNVGILTAGFDSPGIETVIMNRSTLSMPLWLQCTGRGSRPTPAKSAFTIIDLGGNAVSLGDWNSPRDWENIFFNPPKKSEDGVAPSKNCPECDAIIPASSRVCQYCGYEYPAKEVEPEELLSEFVVVTRGIDVASIIEANKHRKEYYPFFKIGSDLAKSAKQTVPNMTDENAEFILTKYDELAREWCQKTNKRYNKWHQERAKEHLYSELAKTFKKWSNPLSVSTPESQSSTALKPLQSISSLTTLNPVSGKTW